MMGLRNKQNIVLIAIVIAIVAIFSFSNYIKQQKVYVLNRSTEEDRMEDYNENNMGQASKINQPSNIEGKIIVHIEGEVARPGVYELDINARVFDAVDKAGGLLEDADRKRVNLARKIVDEEHIYIPNKDDENLDYQYRDNLLINTNTIENTNLININKANIMELKELPGIGDVIANRIIEYRNENGPFKTIDDLKNVNGIGDKKFSDIRDKVTTK